MTGRSSKEPAQDSAGRTRTQTHERPRGAVLVMDDDESVRQVLGVMLRQVGFEVVFAAAGEEAVDKYKAALARGKPFDAVFMDLRIPKGMGALETLRALKELHGGVRAVLMSGDPTDSTVVRSEELGFRAVLAKPFSLDDVRDLVDKLAS